MSPRSAAEFSKQWPALQRRLTAFLRYKGVGAGEIDDLVQEVATRLLSFWHKLDRDKPVWPLTATIALNLLRDRSRRPDLEVLGELPDMPTSFDTAQVGIARIELADVLRAMEDLTPAQRAALWHAIEPNGDLSPSSSAEKMLRMRARRRLAHAVGRACGVLGLKIRRAGDAVHALFSRGDTVAQALACATCLFVTTAGAASLYPEIEGIGIDGAPQAATTTAISETSAQAMSPSTVVSSAEVLSPDRVSAEPGSSAAGSVQKSRQHAAAGGDGDQTAGSSATPGTAVTLPSKPPVPGGGDAPIPAPDPPSPPSAAPAVESGAPAPDNNSPVQGVTEAPLATVETVTGSLGKP